MCGCNKKNKTSVYSGDIDKVGQTVKKKFTRADFIKSMQMKMANSKKNKG